MSGRLSSLPSGLETIPITGGLRMPGGGMIVPEGSRMIENTRERDRAPVDDEETETGRYEIPTPDPGDYGKPDTRGPLEKVTDAIAGGRRERPHRRRDEPQGLS